MEGILLAFHLHLAGEEPLPGHVDGHGVVSHDLGLEVVVVDFEGGVLPHQGILAGFYEEIAFLILDGHRLSRDGQEVLVQLGSQLRIGLLGIQGQGGAEGHQA